MSNTGSDGDPPQRRGRPADPLLDDVLRDAAREILAENGWRGTTVERVAERAGVARTTIYRRHGSVHGVLLLMMGDLYDQMPVSDTGNCRDDLASLMVDVSRVWRDPSHLKYFSALVAAQHESEELAVAFREQARHRRARTITIVTRGIERGELRADTDPDLLLDFLGGVIVQRMLLDGQPMTDEAAEQAVDELLAGFAT